ncbi:hypothetical protein [Larkinella sp. C7]|uniref:hypothetical protein n=1 Tax=Larkinella sp. C7 TaxID=2576607 RepID=UPI001110FF37|nr:hypothetical protein [Larkinella sp. C7]
MENKIVVTPESQLQALIAEAIGIEFRRYFLFIQQHSAGTDPEYIDYKRCKAKYFSSVPDSTLRQKFANNEIPGVTKIGKRLLIHDQTIAHWLQSNRRVQTVEVEQLAEEQFVSRHKTSRSGGRKVS